MDDPAWIAKLLYVYLIAVEGILDPGCSLSPVGHRDHDRRRGKAIFFPPFGSLKPVLAQEIVAVDDQVGKGLVGLGLPVQVLFDPFVDVIELRSVRPSIWHAVVPYDHSGSLHQAGFDGIAEPEVADNPGEEGFFAGCLAGRGKGRGSEIVTGQDTPDDVDPVQAPDPFGSLLYVLFLQASYLGFGRYPPGMMGLVVYDQYVLGIGQVPEDIPDVSLIAPGTSFVHSLLLGDLLVGLPVQNMPVPDNDLGLPEEILEAWRDDVELIIVVAGFGGYQHLQPVSHGEPWGYHKDVLGEPGILGVGGLVEGLPGYEHGHDYGLA